MEGLDIINENKSSYKNEYYINFKSKNADKIKEKIKCEICGGRYDYFNKYKHNKGLKHQYKLLLSEQNKVNDN